MGDLEYEQMLERERQIVNKVNKLMGKPLVLSPLEKMTAERDQLRAELSQERERVKELNATIVATLGELRGMGIWPDKLVGASMRSLLERLIALSAGEGEPTNEL